MTTARERLEEWIKNTPEEWTKKGVNRLERFVLQHGREFQPVQRRPKGLRWMTPKHCYANAHTVATCRPEFSYVEGYAFLDKFPMPFAHAWVCRPGEDRAFDVTAKNMVAYIGIEFKPAFQALSYGKCLKNDCMALIDNWSEHWPLLKMSPEELQAVIAKGART